MKFNYQSTPHSAPQTLAFEEKERYWLHEDGTRFEISGADNVVPMSNNEAVYECLTGYFIVEVTDPKGVIGCFKLHARNDIVSCGIDALYPGVVCDEDLTGQSLKESGLKKPDMDYSFLPWSICYGFNEGAVTSGAIEDNYDLPADKEIYRWQII